MEKLLDKAQTPATWSIPRWQVVRDYTHQGLSQPEIAEKMGISIETVKKHRQRAKKETEPYTPPNQVEIGQHESILDNCTKDPECGPHDETCQSKSGKCFSRVHVECQSVIGKCPNEKEHREHWQVVQTSKPVETPFPNCTDPERVSAYLLETPKGYVQGRCGVCDACMRDGIGSWSKHKTRIDNPIEPRPGDPNHKFDHVISAILGTTDYERISRMSDEEVTRRLGAYLAKKNDRA